VRALEKSAFEVVRIKGSHHFLQHPDGRATVVPVHAGETIGPGLMSKILRDTELSRDEFIELLG
jgi:predicted RNA binding protein YcfA (HicA-like mRNA interferase family)